MNNLTKSKFMTATAFNNIKKQFASIGYPNSNDEGEVTIYDEELAIVKALPHSNGKSYVVAYDTNYMQEKA